MSDHEFKWLHLSDLHVGMTDQDWLWPTLKHSLYADMKMLFTAVGAWDIVIFSGDLTQRGATDEFEKFNSILSDLWQQFKSWGFDPKLIVLPGNHDIRRATSLSPELRLLRKWWDEPEIHREFFDTSTGIYRSAIDVLFKPYNAWAADGPEGIEMVRGKAGFLAGDASYVIEKDDLKVGLVTLNSAWLQLDDSEYEGKLHVDTRQLLAVTENDPHAWCGAHAFNIIITHHPISWLHRNSQADWLSEINPSGRFDLHLFGHMHEPAVSSVSAAGSQLRSSVQAASTFGLAYTKDSAERIHGYSIARLSIEPHQRELRLWPRKLRKLPSGERKLGPDVDFDLAADNSARILLNNSSPTTLGPTERMDDGLSLGAIAGESREVLKKVKHQLPFAPAHANVRKIEQQKLLEIISDKRAAWIVAEWGMGEDGFLSSICQLKGFNDRPVYRLDLTDFKNRDQFLETIKGDLECSFQQFCELISQSGDSFLLLDNFPAGTLSGDTAKSTDREIEEVIQVILEYCSNATVLVRTHRNPISHFFQVVQLKSLDEADLRTYVLDHERGGAEFASAGAVGQLLRYTDGIPTRIDRSLKDLEVITLSELINTDSDVTAPSVHAGETSPALAKSIADLSTSSDATQLRSFSLLKALSLFPQGEQLNRIKRFYSASAFFPAHATELLDQALLEVTTTQGLDSGESGALAKRLVVPRPVRECVRDQLSGDEIFRMNHRAAEIYFGPQWSSGIFKFPAAYKFDEPHCGSADIANANTIIVRLLKEAISQEETEKISRVLGLAEFYLRALRSGTHHRSAVIFCDDFVPSIPSSGHEEKRALMRSLQAQSLRMVGEYQKSKSVILEIIDYPFSKSARQEILLALALCLQSLDECDEAEIVAEKIVKVDRHSSAGLHARALLIELKTDDPARMEKLIQFENLCRKQGVIIVANNIALLRAREAKGDPNRIREILLPVAKPTKDKSDFYNRTRAAIRLAELSLSAGEKLSEGDLHYLVGAYHFLFNERLPGLFDQCHASLWTTFERSSDTANLLILFRHSSLYWRLMGMDTQETNYLKKLAVKVGNIISKRLSNLSREAAYYFVRATAQALIEDTKKPAAIGGVAAEAKSKEG